MNIERAVSGYGQRLEEIIRRERLPEEWFERPDYIAFRPASPPHFDILLRQITQGPPPAKESTPEDLKGQKVMVVRLAGRLAIGESWSVDTAVVIRPDPEADKPEKVGVAYVSFFQHNLTAIESNLRTVHGFTPEFLKREAQGYLSVVFKGCAWQFSNRSLSQVIRGQNEQA